VSVCELSSRRAFSKRWEYLSLPVANLQNAITAIPEIARELGVNAVVGGSVFRSGDTVRMTIQLLQARPAERHLWAGTFQRDLRDVLTLQGEVARGIAERIHVAVMPDETARLARARSVNPAAYEAWLRGWVEMNRFTGPSSERCVAHANEAAAIDAGYGPAYGLAAHCHILSHWAGAAPAPPWEAFPKAKAAARRAIEVDPSFGRAHAMLGFALGAFDWDWAGADRAFQRAIALSPGDAESQYFYSYFLNWMGRHDDAIERARRAEELSPGIPRPMTFRTAALVYARRYDQALTQAQRAVELFSDYGFAYEWLAIIYQLKGLYPESLAAQQQAVRLMGDTDVVRKAMLGRAFAHAGRRDDALQMLADLHRLQRTTYVPAVEMAYLFFALGQTDDALDWLERGYELRDPELASINTYPYWDPLRADPRFQNLLRRLNFPR
jgi:tetratricopeptide (TPR) repeat protein